MRVCKSCHVDKSFDFYSIKKKKSGAVTYQTSCKACRAEAQRSARMSNRDAIRAADRKRREKRTAEQKARQAAYLAEWRKNNPEKIALYRPKKTIRSYSKQYYEKHKDKIKQKTRAYKKNNLDKCREWRHNREKKMLREILSTGIIDKLYKLQKGKCTCCGIKLGDKYHLDHIIPVSKGGTNTDDNVQLLKDTCNMSKSARDPIEYMQSKGYLL